MFLCVSQMGVAVPWRTHPTIHSIYCHAYYHGDAAQHILLLNGICQTAVSLARRAKGHFSLQAVRGLCQGAWPTTNTHVFTTSTRLAFVFRSICVWAAAENQMNSSFYWSRYLYRAETAVLSHTFFCLFLMHFAVSLNVFLKVETDVVTV